VKIDWWRDKVGVLADRNFRRFYTGYVTSLLGTSMSSLAIAWAVLSSGHGATGLGLVFAAAVVPQVLLLAVAGAIADRFGRRRVMLGADVLRCCVQALLAVLLLPASVFPLAPFAGRLVNANALYGLAQSATTLIGPSLAGVLIAVARPATAIGVDALSYAVSALALTLLRIPPRPTHGTSAAPQGTLFRDMGEGWAEFRSRTWLWVVTGQWAFLNLITWAPWMLLGPVMGHDYLGGSAVWGAIMAVQGAGSILAGALLLGRRPRRPMTVATAATFCYALPDIPLALHATAPWVAVAAFCLGAGGAVSNAFFSTAMQQQVPPDKLARVSSFVTFPNYGIGVIGYAIDGPLAGLFGAQLVFGVGAVYGLLSAAVVLSLRPIRAVRWTSRINGCGR
jgi:MFS family permease